MIEKMYETTDIRKGLKIAIDNEPYAVIDFQFVKPGKGNAFTRCKIKNLLTGAVLDRTWKSGEKIGKADLTEHQMQFLYQDASGYALMDQQSFEQHTVNEKMIGDDVKFLAENMIVSVLIHNEKLVSVTLPNFVELEVVDTEPAVRGDTVTGAKKSAKLVTGASIQVPLFIERGEVLKIDTRSGDYVERVKS